MNQSKASRTFPSRTFLVDASFGKMFWWKLQLHSRFSPKKTIKVWKLRSFWWKAPQNISKKGYNSK